MKSPVYLTRQSPGLRMDGDYYETDAGQSGESYKLEVGAQCNRLLAHAAYCRTLINLEGGEPYLQVAESIESLVERVVEFEKLDTE